VLRFREDYPDHKLIRLSQNYRSTETILQAAKQLICKNEYRIDNELFTQRGTGVKIRAVEAYNEHEEARFVVEEIQRLARSGRFDPGQIAIMYRTSAQSRVLEEAFITRGMPYLLVRGTRFYERKEIKDALAYLRLIHNPEDSVSLDRIINVPTRGIGAKTIADLNQWAFELGITPWQAIQRLVVEEAGDEVEGDFPSPESAAPAPFKSRARNALVDFGRLMNMLIGAKARLSLVELFDLTLARTGYKNFIKDHTPEGDERWENLQELRRKAEQLAGLDGAEALALFLEEVALVSDVDALGEEGSAPALLTLHSAKGLEFPVVFMVGMEDGLVPHSRSFSDAEAMEEERRLAYVGITRAADRLYLTRAFRRTTYGFDELTTPSRYLEDIPSELVEADSRRQLSAGPSPGQSRFSSRQAAQAVSSRWNQGAQSSRAAPKQAQFKAGDLVYHRKFGEGTVISVEVESDDELVQVAFPSQGIKKLAASVAPLEKR
jgi:DNA helicase-2/ATP-dependent DNA helicase PcrA